jgi:hypothetical protein
MIMSETPDHWLVVKIISNDGSAVTYKVFATWHGSYLGGSSWKLNSGIKSVVMENDFYVFTGHSGSQYYCHKNGYGNTGYGVMVLQNLVDKGKNVCTIEVLDETTDWMVINYE